MNLQSIFTGAPEADRFWLWVKRILIILAVLAISASAGLAATQGLIVLAAAVVLAFGLVGLYFAERFGRMEYGVLALVPVATLTNFVSLPTGRGSRLVFSLVLALGLVGIWVIQVWFSRDRVQMKKSPVNLPLILWVIACIAALVWSELLRDPFLLEWEHYRVVRLAAMLVNILLPMLALFVGNVIKDDRWLHWLVLMTLGIGTFTLGALVTNLPVTALFQNGTRGLFATWVAALALSLGLFNAKMPLWLRGMLILLAAAWFGHDFYVNTAWLSGWLPMGVAGATVVLLYSRKYFYVLIAALILIAGTQFNWITTNIVDSNLEEGSGNRLDLWKINFQLIEKHPLFGVGPAGYAPYYMTYHPNTAMSTHNNYFDVLAQTGFIGFIVFLWMMGTFLVVGLRVRSRVAGRGNFMEAYVNAVIAGTAAALVSMMLGDWVLPFAYNQTISGFDNAMFTWLFLGGLLAVYQILKTSGDNDSPVGVRQ
jgi:O-antigen ligase